MDKISKKIKVIKHLKEFIKKSNLDGYIIPKNDSYFTEYSKVNNLRKVTKFKGSAGFSLILKNSNYLFVDGRYTLQARQEAGRKFRIIEIPFTFPKDLLNIHGKNIGFNPKLFTENTLKIYFEDKVNLIPIIFNFKNKIEKKVNEIFILNKNVVGENSFSKLKKIKNYMIKNKIRYLYSSASENVNWLVNY